MLQTKNGAGSPAELCLMPAAGLCPTQSIVGQCAQTSPSLQTFKLRAQQYASNQSNHKVFFVIFFGEKEISIATGGCQVCVTGI